MAKQLDALGYKYGMVDGKMKLMQKNGDPFEFVNQIHYGVLAEAVLAYVADMLVDVAHMERRILLPPPTQPQPTAEVHILSLLCIYYVHVYARCILMEKFMLLLYICVSDA